MLSDLPCKRNYGFSVVAKLADLFSTYFLQFPILKCIYRIRENSLQKVHIYFISTAAMVSYPYIRVPKNRLKQRSVSVG